MRRLSLIYGSLYFFFFSRGRRHTRCYRDWSSDVCSSDLVQDAGRNAGLVRQFDKARRRKGHLLARLENERVAGRDRIGPEPARHHRRKIEGGDGGEEIGRASCRERGGIEGGGV